MKPTANRQGKTVPLPPRSVDSHPQHAPPLGLGFQQLTPSCVYRKHHLVGSWGCRSRCWRHTQSCRAAWRGNPRSHPNPIPKSPPRGYQAADSDVCCDPLCLVAVGRAESWARSCGSRKLREKVGLSPLPPPPPPRPQFVGSVHPAPLPMCRCATPVCVIIGNSLSRSRHITSPHPPFSCHSYSDHPGSSGQTAAAGGDGLSDSSAATEDSSSPEDSPSSSKSDDEEPEAAGSGSGSGSAGHRPSLHAGVPTQSAHVDVDVYKTEDQIVGRMKELRKRLVVQWLAVVCVWLPVWPGCGRR
jgi:hypothetical protein